MHEIVTLQFGSQANYVGTHFWNAQESYFTYDGQDESPVDHSVHFREGIGVDGSDTFTPRTIIYDFKSNFGSLRRINELYDRLEAGGSSQAHLWDGSVIAQNQPQVELNSYQSSLNQGLDPQALTTADVRFWSDFNRVFYHPRSIVQVYETELHPGQRAFDEWSMGEELFAHLNREEDLIDRDFRFFLEECDQMQGVQIFAETESAWAAFSSEFLERLRDDVSKLSIWVYGVGSPESDNIRRSSRVVNQAKSLCRFSDQASMYIPAIGFPKNLPLYVSLDHKHPWHTSALQLAGFESVLLPSRLKPSSEGGFAALDHLVLALSGEENHRIAQLSLKLKDYTIATSHTNGTGLENPEDQHQDSNQRACRLFAGQETSLPNEPSSHTFSRMRTTRGEWLEEQENAVTYEDGDIDGRNYVQYFTNLQMPLPDSFPHIFSSINENRKSAPVQAQLEITSTIAWWAKSLEQATRIRVDVQEREELLNDLRSIGDVYAWGLDGEDSEGYSSGE